MTKRIIDLDHFSESEGETANTEGRSLRIIDARCIPTPRVDAVRYRRLAIEAEREGQHYDAYILRQLERAAQDATARRVDDIRARLGEVGR